MRRFKPRPSGPRVPGGPEPPPPPPGRVLAAHGQARGPPPASLSLPRGPAGVSLSVPEGSVVALLGPNGAGKTTTLRVISGTIPTMSGVVRLDGKRINGASVSSIARRGVCLIPEGRGIFPSLSVRDNIEICV